jgi:hypothetical protein
VLLEKEKIEADEFEAIFSEWFWGRSKKSFLLAEIDENNANGK